MALALASNNRHMFGRVFSVSPQTPTPHPFATAVCPREKQRRERSTPRTKRKAACVCVVFCFWHKVRRFQAVEWCNQNSSPTPHSKYPMQTGRLVAELDNGEEEREKRRQRVETYWVSSAKLSGGQGAQPPCVFCKKREQSARECRVVEKETDFSAYARGAQIASIVGSARRYPRESGREGGITRSETNHQ